ncbi:U4/U6 small nuclear ribonucleoprotein Prp3 [Nowakowskiella sp. JEL0407]|nr:U4/U6 small nuclear ribonucleoprotein Prp3 [Nowakowskiella sp. JEL0407]
MSSNGNSSKRSAEDDARDPKRLKNSTSNPSSDPPSQDAMNVFLEAKRKIAERVAALSTSNVRPPLARPPAPRPMLNLQKDDIQRKIDEAKARVQALERNSKLPIFTNPVVGVMRPIGGLNISTSIPSSSTAIPPAATSSTPTSRNYRASLLPQPIFATVKANQRAQTATVTIPTSKEVKQADKKAVSNFSDPTKNPYFDPYVSSKSSVAPKIRTPKTFKFIEPGKYIQLAQQMRATAQLERLKKEIAETVKKAGMDAELELVSDNAIRREPPPDCEWWDTQLLKSETYELTEANMVLNGEDSIVTDLIQHPVPIQPIAEPGMPAPKPVMLTDKERKKLRRQLRAERLKDKQEKIRLGLLPPDEPKVKLSNLMKVLGGDAIQDPTKVEAKVRAQVAARLAAHKKQNEMRKLTPEQRREKTRQKLQEDTSKVVEVAVFRLKDLSNGLNKKKVELNAQQLYLTGVGLVYSGMNMVAVEGGPKGIKKFRKLMLNRINWRIDADGEEDGGDGEDEGEEESGAKGDECLLVWEGEIQRRMFDSFRMIQCPTEERVKEILEKHRSLHYWDACRNFVHELN